MSYRRYDQPSHRGSREAGPPSSSSSSSQAYGGSRGEYSDRRPPPGRGYRDEYDSRGPRRSVSPPYSRESYAGRGGREDRYEGRRDRDYPREGPPPPSRDERSIRHAAPPPPRDGEYSGNNGSRRRQASPPRRAERVRREQDDIGRGRDVQSATFRERIEEVDGKEQEEEDLEEGEAPLQNEEAEEDMMAAMGFGGFGTTKVSSVCYGVERGHDS
ncbi:hypothetical protein CBS101457_002521 [Exobasidium rhododendri]|nr:hypothetical protein CBS101457_002521 [Exobasidium rhododendri]